MFVQYSRAPNLHQTSCPGDILPFFFAHLSSVCACGSPKFDFIAFLDTVMRHSNEYKLAYVRYCYADENGNGTWYTFYCIVAPHHTTPHHKVAKIQSAPHSNWCEATVVDTANSTRFQKQYIFRTFGNFICFNHSEYRLDVHMLTMPKFKLALKCL